MHNENYTIEGNKRTGYTVTFTGNPATHLTLEAAEALHKKHGRELPRTIDFENQEKVLRALKK